MDEIFQRMFLQMMLNQQPARRTRQEIIAKHKKALEDLTDTNNNYTHFFQTTHGSANRGGVRRSNNTSLKPRNRISINDMQIDNVHNGRFLLCRVIEKCYKLTALSTIVEDPEGDVERLSLYNWVPQSAGIISVDQASRYLTVGTVLVVKNPYYKIATDLLPMIRSDDPSEIIMINHDSELLRDIRWSTDQIQELPIQPEEQRIFKPEDFQRRGNENFKERNYKLAIDEYSRGIELEPHNATLLTNRAQSYLRLCLFAKALDDSMLALEHNSDYQKAKFCKGKALCGLKRYQEAMLIFQELIETGDAQNKKSFEEAAKHTRMLECESKGIYDYLSIIEEFKKNSQAQSDGKWIHANGPRLNHADYISDNIEIRSIKHKGRGWVAKQDIPAHTLLMVSKAFHVVFVNEVPLGFSIDWANRCANTPTQSELVTFITQKITADPNLGREFYKLYAGPNYPSVNKLEDQEALSVDIDRIENIVKYNAFNPDDMWGLSKISERESLDKNGTGLWILPSYFNHTCLDFNVVRIFWGDLMFIRSIRAIKKDEELTFSYVDPMLPGEKRLESLKSFGVTCQCRLCKIDRTESPQIIQKRKQLDEYFRQTIRPKASRLLKGSKADPSLIRELEKLISDLNELRFSNPNLNFHIFEPKSALAFAYGASGDSNKSLKIMHELYDLVRPDNLLHYSNKCAFQIANRHTELGQIKKAQKWYNSALRQLVEPVRGKYKENETNWKEEALSIANILEPALV
jgi:tetratricopeptide (TPR) repeat protein